MDNRKKQRVEPSAIKNKIKRSQVYHEQKARQAADKRKERAKRKKEEEELGDEAPPKKVPRTLENTREADETVVTADDAEVLADEAADEFAGYFGSSSSSGADGQQLQPPVPPRVLLTSNVHPSAAVMTLIDELVSVLPAAEYHRRGTFDLKQIVQFAANRGFTDLVVVNENRKKPNGLVVSHLPDGPTMHFKLSSLTLARDLPGHGKITKHRPELILNGFTTRLGHTVGRQLAALFPQEPNFHGRRVVTFHNQRDFIFFRHHRYIFETKEKARLQELGPRFTLKLRSVQKGTFDSKEGEFEWVHKTEMDTSRRRFFL